MGLPVLVAPQVDTKLLKKTGPATDPLLIVVLLSIFRTVFEVERVSVCDPCHVPERRVRIVLFVVPNARSNKAVALEPSAVSPAAPAFPQNHPELRMPAHCAAAGPVPTVWKAARIASAVHTAIFII